MRKDLSALGPENRAAILRAISRRFCDPKRPGLKAYRRERGTMIERCGDYRLFWRLSPELFLLGIRRRDQAYQRQ